MRESYVEGASSSIGRTPGEASLLWTRPPGQRLGGLRTSPATGHCADCHHGASSSIRRTPDEASLLWTRPACQRLGRHRTLSPTDHCADCHVGAPSASDQPESPSSAGDSEKSTAILASCTLPRPALRSAELARLTPNQSLRWRSSWRIICIRRTPKGAVSRERGHPVNTAAPCVRGRPAAGAVSRPMPGDLHPWRHPWPHGWHAPPRPRQGRRGLGARRLLRRRARNAPDQVDGAPGRVWA